MHGRVGAERHVAAFGEDAGLAQKVALFRFVVASPLREIQMTAAVIHVVDNEPRYWRDVGVPRPASLV